MLICVAIVTVGKKREKHQNRSVSMEWNTCCHNLVITMAYDSVIILNTFVLCSKDFIGQNRIVLFLSETSS